jgi:hypothetical protein
MEFKPELTQQSLAPSDRSCMSLRRPFWQPLRDTNPGTQESPRARVLTLLGSSRFLAISQTTT